MASTILHRVAVWCGQGLAGLLLSPMAIGASTTAAAPSAAHHFASSPTQPAPLLLFNREVTELRASLGGLPAVERVERAERRFADLRSEDMQQPVTTAATVEDGVDGVAFAIAGKPMFTLLESDIDQEAYATLAQAASDARRRLEQAVSARIAQQDSSLWLRGIGVGAAVFAVCGMGLWLALAANHRLETIRLAVTREPGAVTYVRVFLLRVCGVMLWLLFAGLLYAGTAAFLGAFPWTQPWSERLAGFIKELGGWLVAGAMAAVPGVLTVALVLLVARAVQDALTTFFRHVQSGRMRVPFLHTDTVGATHRLVSVLVWIIAIAVAYPYIPGSQSDAFKGVTVLFGLMLTLGSTGLVTQLMSGLVVVYSRSLKRGDFVAVNDLEGVVSEVGALAVKIVNVRNEEITVPNSVITASAIRNYSKLSGQQGTLVSTKVTIGYDAPWRQVHTMLVAAAGRTPGVRPAPAPFVYQRALSDFYVEYELFANIDKPLERVPILSALHAAIQDEFNAHGVQIMSPHFMNQPSDPVVVPRDKWQLAPARPD